jgi:uncharacterized protein (TIGR03083 family)
VEPESLLHVADREGRALLASAETTWEQPIPHCPDWDAAELVRHTGTIFGWMAAVVASGERVGFGTLDPPPQDPGDLPPWYTANLRRVLDVLGSTDPASHTWTFSSSGDRRAGWWYRRLAVEISIHRWDVEHAMAGRGGRLPAALDGQVAEAGIEEFMIEFLPGLLAKERPDDEDSAAGGGSLGSIGGTFHLHSEDGSVEWWVDLDTAAQARRQHAKADTAIRGTRSDLLLWLTNRGPLESVELFGSEEVVERWKQFRR